ncbi:hypothetical protein CF335_g2781 [Tilletia laevis]|nr:hypothetical protein CF335_g2781 [Tilletia laevis]
MTQQSTGSDQEKVGGSVGDQIVVLNPQRDLAQLGCFNGDRAIVDLTAARVSRLGQISAPLPSQAQSAQERPPLGQPRRRCVRRFALVEELVSMVRSPCSFQRPWSICPDVVLLLRCGQGSLACPQDSTERSHACDQLQRSTDVYDPISPLTIRLHPPLLAADQRLLGTLSAVSTTGAGCVACWRSRFVCFSPGPGGSAVAARGARP